jgi:hypothetical protein
MKIKEYHQSLMGLSHGSKALSYHHAHKTGIQCDATNKRMTMESIRKKVSDVVLSAQVLQLGAENVHRNQKYQTMRDAAEYRMPKNHRCRTTDV